MFRAQKLFWALQLHAFGGLCYTSQHLFTVQGPSRLLPAKSPHNSGIIVEGLCSLLVLLMYPEGPKEALFKNPPYPANKYDLPRHEKFTGFRAYSTEGARV